MRKWHLWKSLIVAAAAFTAPVELHAAWGDFLQTADDNPKALILGEKSPNLETVPSKEPGYLSPSAPPLPATVGDIYTSPYVTTTPESCENSGWRPFTFNECWCEPPTWTARAGAFFLHRSAPSSATLFQFNAPAQSYNANSLGLGTATGYDFGLTRKITDCFDFDMRYFGVNGWNTSQNIAATTINSNAFGFPFAGAVNGITTNYGSNLNSLEFNGRKWVSDSFAVYSGARWIGLTERTSFAAPGIGTFGAADTNNNLYGGQLGILWQKQFQRFSFMTNASTGIYGNAANANAVTPLQPGNLKQSQSHASFVSDVAFQGTYRITKHIAARAGYQLLWIDGAALAPGQANSLNLTTNTGKLHFDNAFYHGALVGFDITW